MNVEIKVTNPHRDEESSIFLYEFVHVGCEHGQMKYRRDPVNPQFELTCGCGLKVIVPQFGPASAAIHDAEICSDARELPEGSFYSEQASKVTVTGA